MNYQQYMIAHKSDYDYEMAEYFDSLEEAINAMSFNYELYRLNTEYGDIRYIQYHKSEVEQMKKVFLHRQERQAFHQKAKEKALLSLLNAFNN